MTRLSDEFLLAYLDGQLEKSQTANVAQLANANAEVSRRLQRLKRTQAQLLETFGAFAREEAAIPASMLSFEADNEKDSARTAAPHRPDAKDAAGPVRTGARRQLLFIAAVFIGGLLGGYGATFLANARTPLPPKSMDRAGAAVVSHASWTSDLARFHAFFPRETLTPHPDAISNPELIRFQLTKVAAKALNPPDLSRQGYTLYRGQVFNYNQERMMQLTYASKTEPPLTLYVLPATGSSDNPIAVQALGSNKAVSWISDRVRFFLTSDKSEEDLKVLAVIAQSQMPKKN